MQFKLRAFALLLSVVPFMSFFYVLINESNLSSNKNFNNNRHFKNEKFYLKLTGIDQVNQDEFLNLNFESVTIGKSVLSMKLENVFPNINTIRNSDFTTDGNLTVVSSFINSCFNGVDNYTYNYDLKFSRRGNYEICENFFIGSKRFECNESITFVTQSEFGYLDNLISLVDRWEGPISIAVYTPMLDLEETILRVSYLTKCVKNSDEISKRVSFHLFYEFNLREKNSEFNETLKGLVQNKLPFVDCQFFTMENIFNETFINYRKYSKFLYPVNIGRNVARQNSKTHFVLVADIELYPSENLIPKFLNYVNRNLESLKGRLEIFILPIFEVESDLLEEPRNKSELLHLYNHKRAIVFHANICLDCHRFPQMLKWLGNKKNLSEEINVLTTVNRVHPFHAWEPIYIGTKDDPLYDERLSYEGLRDKMTQAYMLCKMRYKFNVLDNAFLVHRKGIKLKRKWAGIFDAVRIQQEELIKKIIGPEINKVVKVKNKVDKPIKCWLM